MATSAFALELVPLTLDQVRAAESATIVNLKPLLNVTYGGRPLPQLRACSQYESARARWLWHASWLGLLLPRFELRSARAKDHWPQSNTHRRRRGFLGRSVWITVRVDEDGFVVPVRAAADRGAVTREVTVPWPSETTVRDLLAAAAERAPVEIQSAVAHTRPQELLSWWAAHAGAPYLGAQAVVVRDAIADSFSPNPAGVSTNRYRMPAEAHRAELLELVDALNRTRH